MSKRHKKPLTAKEYEDLFYEWINSGKPIKTADGSQTLEMVDGEEWKACYDPDDKARKVFPQNWILSDHGNLVSVRKNGKVRLIKKCFNGGRYASHYFGIKEQTIKNRRISLHNLVGVVFGSETYGRATELLKDQGIDAFGSMGDKDKINGHHKNKVTTTTDYSPNNIRILTTEAHKLENIPKDPEDREKVFSYMERCACVASEENPEGMTVVYTGQELNKDTLAVVSDNGYMDIESVNRIILTPDAYKSLVALYNKVISSGIVDRCVEQLTKQFGVEWFQNNDRYFLTPYGDIYKCVIEGEGVLRNIEIFDTIELVNKTLINCYINDKKQAECYIP